MHTVEFGSHKKVGPSRNNGPPKENGHLQELELELILIKSFQQNKKESDCFSNSFNCIVLKIGQGIKLT